MKIEKVTLQRNALCRALTPDDHEYGRKDHDIQKGEKAIKIHNIYLNGNWTTFFLCIDHAFASLEKLDILLKDK